MARRWYGDNRAGSAKAQSNARQCGPRAGGRLASFASDAELIAFLNKRAAAQRAKLRRRRCRWNARAAPPPPAAEAATADANIVVTGSRVASDKITNTQEADVDEGGIVKKRGDLLIVLRRGRLFTVSIAGGGMRPIDHIDAYPPGVSGGGDWYDEMLISGRWVMSSVQLCARVTR